jgi:hypothetical protein
MDVVRRVKLCEIGPSLIPNDQRPDWVTVA